MSLTKLLRVSPVKYSVLGPSAESLLVTYRFPGVKVRVSNGDMEKERSLLFTSNVPSPYFHFPDKHRSVYAMASYERRPFSLVRPPRIPKYTITTNTASATTVARMRDTLYLEKNDA